MKKLLVFALVLFSLFTAFAGGNKEESNEITVYAYDSFAGDWGPGSTIIPAFEEKTGIKVNLVNAGDAGEMLSRVISEGENCPADVVIGISDDMAYRAYDSELFAPYDSPMLENISSELIFDEEKRLLPFDYGVFAFVYDTESSIKAPSSLEDLRDPYYKDQIILIDPRTSSVGLGLLMWTYNIYGDDYLSWWKDVSENMLTMADGWSTAYGLFTEGEAPLVISYTTSPAYHVREENTTRYQALVFDEGHEETIEAIGILKSAGNREAAEAFVDFILSEEQLDLAVYNSMYPANTSIQLPSEYEYAPLPEKTYKSETYYLKENLDIMLDEWILTMTE